MAFTTTRGESGVDFIGTDGVDALFVLNESGTISVDAKGGNDNVDLTNETGVVGNAEVKLGEGNDTFTTGLNDTNNNRLLDSTVNGGPGDDNLTTEGALSTKMRGNEGDDDFFLTSNYTNVTVNGNSGQDSFTLNTDITLSDSKILGGSGNDGQMDFNNTGFSMLAVDSVIQGGAGLDTITIGDLTNSTSGFRVSGGKDNDTINILNTNAGVDGVAYNGADGDDAINFTTNAGDASSKGGNGNDRFSLAGSGKIQAFGEAGDDIFTFEAGLTSESTVTGGAGADSYSFVSPEKATVVLNSVSESAAATSGTAVTFDTFSDTVDNTGNDDVIDLNSGKSGEELVGNRLNSDEVTNNGAIADQVAGSFAALKALLDNGLLTASISNLGGANVNTGRISLQFVGVDADADGAYLPTAADPIGGFYAILNNTNTILDGGDMMFKMAATNGVLAAAESVQIHDAIEAGF